MGRDQLEGQQGNVVRLDAMLLQCSPSPLQKKLPELSHPVAPAAELGVVQALLAYQPQAMPEAYAESDAEAQAAEQRAPLGTWGALFLLIMVSHGAHGIDPLVEWVPAFFCCFSSLFLWLLSWDALRVLASRELGHNVQV